MVANKKGVLFTRRTLLNISALEERIREVQQITLYWHLAAFLHGAGLDGLGWM